MTLEQQLTEAKAAYHRLMIGDAAKVYVDQNGERVEFVQASAGRLAAYIADLERQLGLRTLGPMRAWL